MKRLGWIVLGGALAIGLDLVQPVAAQNVAQVNTELPAAAALADNTSNPTVPGVASYLMCYDGSTWDRCIVSQDARHDSPALSTGPNIMAEFDDSITDSVDEDDAGRLRISANRNLFTTIRDAAGNERGVNVNASNQLAIAGPVTNAGTFAVQVDGSALTSLQLLDDTIFTDEGAFTYATSKVNVLGAVAESTTDALTDGLAGAVSMTLNRYLRVTPTAYATGGASAVIKISDNTNDDEEHAVCTADCTIYSVTAFNHAATSAFVRCENDTAGNTTPGSETASANEPDFEIPGSTTGAGFTMNFGAVGVSYSTALTCWIVTEEAASGTTDVGDADVRVYWVVKQ